MRLSKPRGRGRSVGGVCSCCLEVSYCRVKTCIGMGWDGRGSGCRRTTNQWGEATGLDRRACSRAWRDDDAAGGPAAAIATAVQGCDRGEMQDRGPETKYGHDHMRLLVDEQEEEEKTEDLFLFCSGDRMQRQQPVSLQLRHVTTKDRECE